jgi:hypothetical protein
VGEDEEARQQEAGMSFPNAEATIAALEMRGELEGFIAHVLSIRSASGHRNMKDGAVVMRDGANSVRWRLYWLLHRYAA